jgi:hypothetical protein
MQQTKQNTHIRTLNPKAIHPLTNQFFVYVCVYVSVYMYVCVYIDIYIHIYTT